MKRQPRWVLVASVLLLLDGAAHAAPSAPGPASRPIGHEVDPWSPVSPEALPLRLSRLDPGGLAAVPSAFSCQESAEEANRTQSLIQLSAASLPLTRRLTLHGFSRWGCPRTSAAAVGLTHPVQLSPRLAWVIGAGASVFPHAGRGWLARPTLRSDLQWKQPDGTVRTVGIEAVEVLKSAVRAGASRRIGASIRGSF